MSAVSMTNVKKGHKGFLSTSVDERFWSKVDIRSKDECWAWTGAHDGYGRGQFWKDGKNHRAPRIAWSLHWNTPFPDGLLACHTCDNPACCNPLHIWPGTMQQNILDAVQKGRVSVETMCSRSHNREKTHCHNGHEYSEENTYINARTGSRTCRICAAKSRKRYDARKAASAALKGDT